MEIQKKYTGAGILFYKNNHFLMGFSHHLKKWSGFGGKIEQTDTSALHTAVREVVEEIFGIDPEDYIVNFLTYIQIKKQIDRKGYILYICDIDQLIWIATCLILFGKQSPYYTLIPTTVMDIICMREAPKDAEIPSIEMVHKKMIRKLKADYHFLNDIDLDVGV
jgi:hypothetical protein